MSVLAPPSYITWTVDQHAPGYYWAFFDRLRAGVTVPVTASSWWRDREANARAGGHPDSQHLVGWAVDLAARPADLRTLAAGLRRAGLVSIEYPTHVHAQLLQAGVLGRSGLLSLVI